MARITLKLGGLIKKPTILDYLHKNTIFLNLYSLFIALYFTSLKSYNVFIIVIPFSGYKFDQRNKYHLP